MVMNKKLGSCLLVAACVVMSSRVAAADGDDLGPQKNSVSLGLTAGVFLPDRDVHDFYYFTNTWQPLKTAGAAMGVRVGYDMVRYAGLELEGEMVPIGTAVTDDSATMLGWRAQLVGQIPARLTPFVLVGGGAMGIISGDGVLGDDTDLTWHTGAGAKFFITSRWSIRLDGRWLIAPKYDMVAADDPMVSHFLVTSALSWTFGNKPAPVEKPNLDPDDDHVIGKRDKCPFDAGVEPDGCPAVADGDRDGIPDADDKCPAEAEVFNDIDDVDGCPDKDPDKDGDGFADSKDLCADVAEDVDGYQDADGCPETDNDGDGVADAQDGCAQAAGPADNRGCPDKDTDGDSVVDRFDNCPADAGSEQHRGCRSKQLVVITSTEIKVLQSIYFRSGKVRIRSRSNSLLDNLAQVLHAHPEITRVHVEGHTDNRGDADRNKDLSQRRAQAVVDYLVGKGISTDRLEAIGRGEESPIADNKRSAGRSQNRRVEFRVERSAPATP
jgi:outer membrane protein OmpA-like peptidoglycan-associated protein/opacity protein-like surface antigen